MTTRHIFAKAVVVCAALIAPVWASAATYTYVGSWQVYDPNAPMWTDSPPNGPLAYTGQEAAALLFGGAPSDYVISTVDNNPNNIDFQAWYDVIGVGGNIFAQDYNNKYLGQFYGPTSGYPADLNLSAASAFVRDNSVYQTNYAFSVSAVPEPETYAMLLAGLGVVGFMGKRRRAS